MRLVGRLVEPCAAARKRGDVLRGTTSTMGDLRPCRAPNADNVSYVKSPSITWELDSWARMARTWVNGEHRRR